MRIRQPRRAHDIALTAIVAALRDRAKHGPRQRRAKPTGSTNPAQVKEALRCGNEIRAARGKLRAELLGLGDPAGRDRFCEILTTLTEHDALASMRLFDALGYIPGFGAPKIQRVRDAGRTTRSTPRSPSIAAMSARAGGCGTRCAPRRRWCRRSPTSTLHDHTHHH